MDNSGIFIIFPLSIFVYIIPLLYISGYGCTQLFAVSHKNEPVDFNKIYKEQICYLKDIKTGDFFGDPAGYNCGICYGAERDSIINGQSVSFSCVHKH